MNLMKRLDGFFTGSPQRVWVSAIVLGMILTPGFFAQNLFAQDGGETSGLKGLRPVEERPVEKESVEKESVEKEKSEAETKKADPDQGDSSKEKPADTRSELDKLIDEQISDLDPLDILDANDPTAKVGQLVDEISKNMKEIERLLDQDDTGESNQSMQQQTLSRIDELINEVQKLSGG